jgi:hypothetical protein
LSRNQIIRSCKSTEQYASQASQVRGACNEEPGTVQVLTHVTRTWYLFTLQVIGTCVHDLRM